MNSPTSSPRRAYWLKTLHEWHWITSAIALIGMLFFSITGITLNNVAVLESAPVITNKQAQLPAALNTQLASMAVEMADEDSASLPAAFLDWTRTTLNIDTHLAKQEWSDRDLNLSLQRPGGDAWMSINFSNGAVKFQDTDNGLIAYLNDLHKGHYTSTAWAWLIDGMGVSCLIFALTGFFILFLHAKNRPATWPLVALGMLIPVLLALLTLH